MLHIMFVPATNPKEFEDVPVVDNTPVTMLFGDADAVASYVTKVIDAEDGNVYPTLNPATVDDVHDK